MVWVKPDGMPQYSGDRPGMGYEALFLFGAEKVNHNGMVAGTWCFHY